MEKKILLLSFLTLFLLSANSQERDRNFYVEGSEVIWQKVLDGNFNKEELIDKIQDSGMLENISIGDNKISGDLKPIEADYRGAGYTTMGTPMIIARSFITGFVIAEFKEGKYRITIKRIVLTQRFSDPLVSQGQKSTLESIALNRRNEFTSIFRQSSSEILDYTFSNRFEFSENANDDW